MTRTSRGLPGFLRRTLRSDYDVDDQEGVGGGGGGGGRRRREAGGNHSLSSSPTVTSSGGGGGGSPPYNDNHNHNDNHHQNNNNNNNMGRISNEKNKENPSPMTTAYSENSRSNMTTFGGDGHDPSGGGAGIGSGDDDVGGGKENAFVVTEESEAALQEDPRNVSGGGGGSSSSSNPVGIRFVEEDHPSVEQQQYEQVQQQQQQQQQQQNQQQPQQYSMGSVASGSRGGNSSNHTSSNSAAPALTSPTTPTMPPNHYFVPSVIRTEPEKRKSYKEAQFDKTISADIVNVADLRRLAWNGIVPCHRSQAWKFMLGYLPTNVTRRQHTLRRKRQEYVTAIQQHYDVHDDSRTNQEQETLRQVLVDVPRTAPDVPLFRNERIRKLLSRLLYIWAMRHPASSYVQGINDLATPFVAVFLSDYYHGQDVLDGNVMLHLSQEKLDQIEADCYWCLTNLLAGIQDHYTSDQPGVQRMVLRLEELVNRIDANLCQHLKQMGIEFMQFAFKWMNCLLLREFSLKCVIRLWDTYISEKDGFEDFHVYVCAAFLCQFSTELQSMDFDQLFAFMQQMPTENWGDTEIEMLLSQAFVLSTLFAGSDAHLNSSNHNLGQQL